MKKSLFLIVLTALLCLVCALALTACEEEPAPAPVCQHRDADDNALCDKCNESYTDGTDVTDAHTHTWGAWIETTAPTCTTQGIKTRACACGQSETQYVDIDSNAHVPASTWTTDGTHHWKVCTRTGCTAQLSKTTHSYGDWVETLAPTCVAEGSHYKTCTTCSYKVTEAIPIDASNHAPAADWTTDGTHHWKACTRTGCTVQLSKTTHSYGAWTKTLAATCVTEGSHYRDCTVCAYRQTEAIPIDASNHAPATTWEKDATGHWHKCTNNGCTVQLSKTTHSYGNWVEILAPTCVAEGSHYKTCTTCSHKVTEAIPIDASNHAPATAWTTDGTHHWKVCTRTGCTVQLSKTTHSYGNWVETLAPTCVAEGSHYKTCTTCSHKVTEAIPIDASKHAPASTWEKDATGHWHKCTRCNAPVNKTTHTYGDWVETLAPTCVAEGSHYKTCTTCSHKVTEAIPIDASKHAPATTWEKDAIGHRGICSNSGCNYMYEKVPHTYNAQNICTACAHAYEEIGLVFTLKNGTYTVTDYTGTATEVIIPATYKGVAVTGIGASAFYSCSNLTTITIPASVTSIGDDAFYKCDSLTSVTIPANVTSIGNWAFCGCSNLTSVTISAGVRSIGNFAFYGCSGLTSITVASGNAKYHSAGNCVIETATGTLVLGCKNSVIPTDGSVTSIGDGAFFGCSNLTTITIPASVTSIGSYAFEDCSNLTSVTIPASVTSIGYGAFRNCSNLTSITIPASVTSIGDDAFYNCTGLTAVEFGANSQLTSIGASAFSSCSELTTITIPASVTSIGEEAFSYCSKLISVTIPASVTSIGTWAFRNCSNLTTVEFGANSQLTSIGDRAFSDCSNLTSVTIPASVTSIGKYAFEYCSDLTSITIPASVTSIGYEAFYNCSNLTSVYISDLAAWCNIEFEGTDANPLYYAENLYLNGQLVTALKIPSGITAIKDYAFYYCSDLTSVTIPASVTSIGSSAFYNCYNLTSVTIPASVTSIGGAAFRYCPNLTSVTIPASVTSIGEYAFSNCSNLTAVEFGANSQLTGIGSYAFYSCDSLTSVTIPASVTSIGDRAFYYCTGLTTVEFGANSQLTGIGYEAFSDCSNLTSITIPASVTSIGYGAFYYCSNLTTVTFANPNGWWYASYSDATSGTAILAADLSDASTAATYLKSTYRDYYWKRT